MAESQLKKVALKERALIVGNIVGVNAYRADRVLLKQRFAEGGYQAHETPHFLLFMREQAPATVVAHWFPPQVIDANIGHYFIEELKPFGVVACLTDFGNLFGAIVGSIYPFHVQQAWRLYADNTIERFRAILEGRSKGIAHRTIDEFAAIYKRVMQLLVGDTMLDAGCSFGFLPLLIAEYVPSIKQIVGVDILTDSFATVRAMARERQFMRVAFMQADLLSNDFSAIGRYDNVVALHVLEHFPEADMYLVLANLLKVTTRRLIVAVPFEAGKAESAYGHEQIFTPAKLESVGQWCLDRLGGKGRISSEDCEGGLLLIERAFPAMARAGAT